MIGRWFLGPFVSLFLGSKYILSSHINWVFYGFRIISFSKLVNVAWDFERTFKELCPLQVMSISVTCSMLSSDQVQLNVFLYLFISFLILFFRISYPASKYITSFSSPHISFQNFFILSLVLYCPLAQLVFSVFLSRIFWNPSGRSYCVWRICHVYQIVFPSVFLLALPV